jgi:hypothetical protein
MLHTSIIVKHSPSSLYILTYNNLLTLLLLHAAAAASADLKAEKVAPVHT